MPLAKTGPMIEATLLYIVVMFDYSEGGGALNWAPEKLSAFRMAVRLMVGEVPNEIIKSPEKSISESCLLKRN